MYGTFSLETNHAVIVVIAWKQWALQVLYAIRWGEMSAYIAGSPLEGEGFIIRMSN